MMHNYGLCELDLTRYFLPSVVFYSDFVIKMFAYLAYYSNYLEYDQ